MTLGPGIPPRIVLLASHHASRRGSAISLAELGTRLPEHGYEPLFVFSKPGPLADELSARGFKVLRVKRQGLLRFGMIRQIQAIIREHRVALVHVNSAVPFSKYIALAARLMSVPVIWHIREPVEDKRMARQRPWIRRLASAIVVLTRQQGRFFDMPTKTERVFNGVDVAHFERPADWPARPAAAGDFVFIQVGSIEHNKGQLRSIQALAMLLEEMPNCRLNIVGSVVEEDEMRAIRAALDQQPRLAAAVRLLGESRDMRPLLWSADCLLLPSLRESFPRTIMEGMAAGLPVIASKVGAVEDMIRDGVDGLQVPPDNVAAVAEAMRRVAAGGGAEALRMGANGHEAAKRTFDIAAHVATVAGIYERLLLAARK